MSRPRDDLVRLLGETRQFLTLSAASFDGGFEAEAKRMAVTLRVLLHDTGNSHSLLSQLGVKQLLTYVDSSSPIVPSNLMPTPGLMMMRMAGGEGGKYVPYLGEGFPALRNIDFEPWWTEPVMKVNRTWTRKQLVLALANKEGGAHVDPDLNNHYVALARQNEMGWVSVWEDTGVTVPFEGDPVAIAVRQITWEVLRSFDDQEASLGV